MNGFFLRWSRRLTIPRRSHDVRCLLARAGLRTNARRSGDLSPATAARAGNQSCTPLTVEGDEVNICRDDFGVPHIFAETNKGLFQGYGYAIAQDRLWQLELFRRAAKGRLAEILGANALATNLATDASLTALAADTDIRTRHYTDAELQDQYALLYPRKLRSSAPTPTASIATSPRWSLLTRRTSFPSSSTTWGLACPTRGRRSTWWRTPSTSHASDRWGMERRTRPS